MVKYLLPLIAVMLPVVFTAAAQPWQPASLEGIVVADGGDAGLVFAGRELAHYLSRQCGRAIPVKEAAGEGSSVRLVRDRSLAPDAYRISFAGNDLEIAGGAQFGPVYGVYALLEDDFGCRWYEPDWTVIPEFAAAAVEVRERTEAPAFPAMRDPNCFAPLDPAWTLANRVSTPWIAAPEALGEYLRYPLSPEWWMSHTVQYFHPAGLFAQYPETFMMTEAGTRSAEQPCPSHPEVRKHAAAGVLEALRANPQVNIINVSWNDNLEACRCPDCRLAAEREGAPGAAFFELVNQVARAAAVEFPRVKVSFLAYYFSFQPPRQMRMEANTVAWVAFLGGRRMNLPVERQANFPAVLKGWAAAAPEVHIWDYQVFFPNFFQYETSLAGVAENLRYYRDHGVTGVMIQGSYPGRGGDRQGLRNWVEAKLLWNPDLELLPLIDDYLAGVFGVAAPSLRPFFLKLYELEMEYEAASGHWDELEALGKHCFTQAYAAAGDDARLRRRLELEELPLLLLQLEREGAKRYRAGSGYEPGLMEKTLDRIEAIAQREDVRCYGEGKSMAEFLNAQRAKLDLPPLSIADATAGAIVVPAGNGLLFGARLEGDTVIQNGDDANWAWQLPCAALPVEPDTAYRLRLLAEVLPGPDPEARAFTVGVYDNATGKELLQCGFSGRQLLPGSRWYELGTVALPSSATVYSVTGKAAAEIRIKALEAAPVLR